MCLELHYHLEHRRIFPKWLKKRKGAKPSYREHAFYNRNQYLLQVTVDVQYENMIDGRTDLGSFLRTYKVL
jgi:hypothetical protein